MQPGLIDASTKTVQAVRDNLQGGDGKPPSLIDLLRKKKT